LTMVGGKIVYASGPFATLDEPPPPAMPDWSPVRAFGGYAAWGTASRQTSFQRNLEAACGCASSCYVHGHAHATSWSAKLPIADLKSFWGALGCACWAV
jgi:hypothetical protein